MKSNRFDPTIGEVEVTEEVKVKGLMINGKFWKKIVRSEFNSDYVLNGFTMRNVAEKEDEEDWWKIFGTGCEVSGNTPENAVKQLEYVASLIGEVIGKS